MGQLIYAFLYTVDPESKVAREHPDWVVKDGSGWSATNTLDMSRPEVVAFMGGTRSALKFWASEAYTPMSDQRTHSFSWMEFGSRWNKRTFQRTLAVIFAAKLGFVRQI